LDVKIAIQCYASTLVIGDGDNKKSKIDEPTSKKLKVFGIPFPSISA
jgi:hypothetical protein